ncbi:MAG: hypothetical protein WC310_01685 [Patescibacteria group bacterium]|jgi:hypothetical protein
MAKKQHKTAGRVVSRKRIVKSHKTGVGGALALCTIFLLAIVVVVVTAGFVVAGAQESGTMSLKAWLAIAVGDGVLIALSVAIWKFRDWKERQPRRREFVKKELSF